MPKLQVLWVNKNSITNLSIFIEKVASSFPDLRYLAMLDNAAAPSYFNGGSKQEYEDYRYNINRLLCHGNETEMHTQLVFQVASMS